MEHDDQLETLESLQIIEEGPIDDQLETVECFQIIEEVESGIETFGEIIDEGLCVTDTDTEDTPQVAEEVSVTENSPQVAEEVTGICSLCSAETKYFFINLNLKVLMCNTLDCANPFCNDHIQYKTFEYADDYEMSSTQNSGSQYSDSIDQTTVLNSSTAQLGIAETNNVAIEDKFNHQFLVPKSVIQKGPEAKAPKREKSSIENHLEQLEERIMQLHEFEKRKGLIGNQKWIDKLKDLQDKSGFVLLQPEEMNNVSVETNNEMKLDIEKGDGNEYNIKILMAPPESNDA